MFTAIVQHLTSDTLTSLAGFGAELVLCATIVVILVSRLFAATARINAAILGIIGAVLALLVLSPLQPLDLTQSQVTPVPLAELPRVELFTGMLIHDGLSVVIKTLLLVFLVLFFILTMLTRGHLKEDGADFTTLVLGATLGMCLMASANHALVIFLAVEMASVPMYALAGFRRSDRHGSEAALKFAVYGAATAGVMLYGISLLTGVLGSAHLPTMAERLSAAAEQGFSVAEQTMLIMAALMIAVGIAFKLSAVPFHQWSPDVFEGATAEVGALLSVASKMAALALLVRVVIGLGVAEATPQVLASLEGEVSAMVGIEAGQVVELPAGAAVEEATAASGDARPVRLFLAYCVALMAAITCSWGNVAALVQTNLKRLLAYSTIAHAGYMLMGIPPILALAAPEPVAAAECAGYLALYMAVYLLMNLGAFAVVALVRDALGTEEIADYAGLLQRSPWVAIAFSILLVSLVGLPPLAGFLGKFAVFAGLARAYSETGETYLAALLVIGCLNTALSLFYYVRVIKTMTIDQASPDTTPLSYPIGRLQVGFLWCITLPVLLLMLGWDFLHVWLQDAMRGLIS